MALAEDSKKVDSDEKEFEEVLKHLRSSVATKHALIKKEKVEYVTGAKLIEGLMSSKWAQSDTAYIKSRDGAIRFCQKLLEKQYLIGGKKIEMKKSKKDDDEEEEAEEEETKKKVRRFRIDWSPVKKFTDGSDDIYIWRYEVPGRYKLMIGIAVMLVIVAFTLQPLWPDSSKYGMWYISIIMMILLGVLILIYIVRWFIWGIVYTFSTGKVELWILPNLDDEKRGFIDSFKPMYSLKFRKKKKPKKEQQQEGDNNQTKEN